MFRLESKNMEIGLVPTRFQVVSAEEYLRLYTEKRDEIASAKIIPPKLGSNDFGKVVIEWKYTVFAPFSSAYENIFPF